MVDNLAVLALARDAQGSGEAALVTLRRALALAEPEGYVRTFLQDGAAIFSLLARLDGRLRSERATDLIIAEGTVKRHLHNIYGKLGATSRTQAIAAARRLGILSG